MSPHIMPKSLFKSTLEKVEDSVNAACVNIEARYGKYDTEECRQAVSQFQQYLLCNIPGIVLDEVCEERKNNPGSPYNQDHDVRINLAVYMHNNMRTFNVGEARLTVDDSFWITQLSRLHNLIVLDMRLTCTDEILEVIGKTCLKLEQINIVSRLAPEQVKINARRVTFNALKLKFFISDKGLLYLSNCKQLRKITMNKMLRSNFAGRMMTDAGIRKLVKSLPHVQTITYDDMGIVISEDMDDVDTLPLTYLSDHHPRVSHIKAASMLCKNLQHLCLHLPNQPKDRDIKASEILEVLTNCDLKVSNLELFQFPCNKELFALLKTKGNYLTNFLLQTDYSLCGGIVTLIGQNCPHLRSLQLKEIWVIGESNRACEHCDRFNSYTSEPLFCNLQCLYLWGNKWNPDVILPLCLMHAKQIENITLLKTNDIKFLDEVIAKIISNNPLTQLKSIHMFTGCLLSITTMRHFLKYCPNLAELSFMRHADIRNVDIKEIHDEIKHNNLDLRIYSMETTSG